MQHEGINIRSEFGNQKRYPVGHQTRDKMDIAAEPVKLGDHYGATLFTSLRKCSGELGPALQSV